MRPAVSADRARTNHAVSSSLSVVSIAEFRCYAEAAAFGKDLTRRPPAAGTLAPMLAAISTALRSADISAIRPAGQFIWRRIARLR